MKVPSVMHEQTNISHRDSTLGVVAISYNEERDLPGFLDSLLPWVDEIVLVDDGSTDATETLASEAGDKVTFIKSPRKEGEYFANQRNKGIRAAASDWLLHMDIDERVRPELAIEIMATIMSSEFDAYRYRRLNYFLNRPMRGGGWETWNLVHLARREVLRFEGMYHERCVLSVPDTKVGQLKARMWHLNDVSYASRMRKSFNYCHEQAVEIAANNTKLKWHHLIVYPLGEFLKKYIYKRGFRDGALGLLFCLHSAGAMFRACALVWDEQHSIPREELEQVMKDMWKESAGLAHDNPQSTLSGFSTCLEPGRCDNRCTGDRA
jgi:(heptosyl)LPS beta-1,4-glucosyltransferase